MVHSGLNGSKSHVDVVAVPPMLVSELWPIVLPMIERAYSAVDRFVPSDLKKRLCLGDDLLWLAKRGNTQILAICISSLEPRPSGTTCLLKAAAGRELQEWVGTEEIEKYAKAEGCVRVWSEGRDGWERVMPGYERVGVILEKRI